MLSFLVLEAVKKKTSSQMSVELILVWFRVCMQTWGWYMDQKTGIYWGASEIPPWLWVTERTPTHLFIFNISRWILHHWCGGGRHLTEENTKIRPLGACGGSPSPNFLGFVFCCTFGFAVFLSLFPSVLTSSLKTGTEALAFSEEKWTNESLKEKCAFCQISGAIVSHRWLSK